MSEDTCWIYSAAAYPQAECDTLSVVEGTMIATSLSSSVAVENLEIGDPVLSRNISGLPDSDEGKEALYSWSSDNIDGTYSTALVTTLFTTPTRGIYNFNNGALLTTRKHNHVVKRNGLWLVVRAHQIQVGDIFQDINLNEVTITSIDVEDNFINIYSLNVETDDVYYANNILTHNDR